MPSGMHLMKTDIINFTTIDNYRAIALFKNVRSDESNSRGVKMFSIGIIFGNDDQINFSYLSVLNDLSSHIINNENLNLIPEKFISLSDNNRYSNNSTTLIPSNSILTLLDLLGPLILLLFRLLLARKRVIVFFRPVEGRGVGFISSALKLMTDSLKDDDDINECKSTFIGNVGLIDIDRLKDMKGGWIACEWNLFFISIY